MTFKITTNDQVHFIGIGGIGMSGIAEIMHNIGFKVQGSDTSRNNKNIKRLQKQGLKIFYNHKKKNIGNSKLVVFSSAINKGNPELREAKRKKIPVIQRVEMLSVGAGGNPPEGGFPCGVICVGGVRNGCFVARRFDMGLRSFVDRCRALGLCALHVRFCFRDDGGWDGFPDVFAREWGCRDCP